MFFLIVLSLYLFLELFSLLLYLCSPFKLIYFSLQRKNFSLFISGDHMLRSGLNSSFGILRIMQYWYYAFQFHSPATISCFRLLGMHVHCIFLLAIVVYLLIPLCAISGIKEISAAPISGTSWGDHSTAKKAPS